MSHQLTQTSVRETVRDFVAENFMLGAKADVPADGESLVGNGVIDSTGVLELVAFVEEQFGLFMEDDELIPENLDSISNIVGFVARKTAV